MALVPFWVRFPPDSFCVTVRSPGKSACEVPTTRPLTATFPRAASMAPEPGTWAHIIPGITARNAHRPLRLRRHFLFGLMPYAPCYLGLAYHCDASRDSQFYSSTPRKDISSENRALAADLVIVIFVIVIVVSVIVVSVIVVVIVVNVIRSAMSHESCARSFAR